MGLYGGTTVEVETPGPSNEELALMREQTQLLREYREEINKLKPIMLQSIGYKEDESGNIVPMTEEELLATMTPLQRQYYEVQKLQLERLEKALKGELPLSEATQQRYEEERQQFEEAMTQRLGPNWRQSTPGIQAEKAFEQRWDLIKEAERKGELTTGMSALAQMTSLTQGWRGSQYTQLKGLTSQYPSLLTGYSMAMQPYQLQRQMQYEADVQNAMTRAGLLSDIGGLVGILGSAAILASARKYKKDIKKHSEKDEQKILEVVKKLKTPDYHYKKDEQKVLEIVKKLKTYNYHYKGEPSKSKKHIGVIADEAPKEIVPPDRKGIDIGRQLGMLTVAVKALAKKMDKLEERRVQ